MKNTFKIIVAILLLVTVITGCDNKTERAKEPSILQDSLSDESRIDGNELYNDIFSKVSKGDIKISFDDFEEEEIIREYKHVISEHPELFWLGDGYSYETKTDNNGKTVTFECAHISMQNITEKRAEFDRIVDEILYEANSQKTPYEKVIYIHDYIVDNTQYDQETYSIMNESKVSKEIYEATTAYGCLVNKKAVCSGYSAAFQLLMQKLGVQSGRVSGRKSGGEDHEWNYIVLDNEYYYVDVTWDDPINDDSQDLKTYEFFCITTDELNKTHEIDGDQFVPECTAKKYDYYIYNNLYLDKYNYDEFRQMYKNNINDKLTIKFSDAQELKKALDDLVDGQKIYNIADGKHSCSYSVGTGGLVLTITMT